MWGSVSDRIGLYDDGTCADSSRGQATTTTDQNRRAIAPPDGKDWREGSRGDRRLQSYIAVPLLSSPRLVLGLRKPDRCEVEPPGLDAQRGALPYRHRPRVDLLAQHDNPLGADRSRPPSRGREQLR